MDALAELGDAALKFVVALLLAGALGLERERKGRGAGLRTHVLVCLGSTLVMVVAEMFVRRAGAGTAWTEMGRMAAGILTGIGFLGAGTIITVGGTHRGLTTAAMVWFVAALGIAIGAGFYLIALCATLMALFVAMGLEYIERALPGPEHILLTMRVPTGLESLNSVESVVRAQGFKVSASRIRMTGGAEHVEMSFDLSAPGHLQIEELAALLQKRFSSAEQISFQR